MTEDETPGEAETPAEAPETAPADPTPTEEAPSAPAAESEPPAAPSEGMVRLTVAGPVGTTAMRFPQDDGSMLVVTRAGQDVPAADADDLIETARKHGVRLTRSTE